MNFIEIDGVKYKVDPEDSTKPLLDEKGEKVLYVEDEPQANPTPDPTPEPEPEPTGTDPEKLKLQQKVKDFETAEQERKEKAEKDRHDALAKQGKFEDLVKEKQAELDKVKAELKKTRQLADKDKAVLKQVLDSMTAQIPEDKRTLIPSGAYRVQIKYIIAVSYTHLTLPTKA